MACTDLTLCSDLLFVDHVLVKHPTCSFVQPFCPVFQAVSDLTILSHGIRYFIPRSYFVCVVTPYHHFQVAIAPTLDSIAAVFSYHANAIYPLHLLI